MKVVTTDFIKNRDIEETIGEVRGNSVKAVFAGKDFLASIRSWFGGEVTEYAELMEEARNTAIEQLKKDARQVGGDAVINLRFTSSQIGRQNAEILAFGTAVKLT